MYYNNILVATIRDSDSVAVTTLCLPLSHSFAYLPTAYTVGTASQLKQQIYSTKTFNEACAVNSPSKRKNSY